MFVQLSEIDLYIERGRLVRGRREGKEKKGKTRREKTRRRRTSPCSDRVHLFHRNLSQTYVRGKSVSVVGRRRRRREGEGVEKGEGK